MARYEFTDETSQKFWEIVLTGSAFTCRWGQLGARPRQLVKRFDTEAGARAAYDRLVRQKLAKGYVLVPGTLEPDVMAPEVRSQRGPLPAVDTTAFEAAVIANPDDVQAVLVLADALQAAGDSWGELIVLQHSLKNETDADRFLAKKRAAEAHASEHEPGLLGPVFGLRHLVKLEWRFGLVVRASIDLSAAAASDPNLAELVSLVLGLRPAFALERLSLVSPRPEEPDLAAFQAAITALVEHPRSSTLKSLALGARAPWRVLGSLAPLAALGALRTLTLWTPLATFDDAAFPQLDRLEVLSGADDSVTEAAARGAFPALTTLVVDEPLLDLGAIARALPRLTHLKARRTEDTAMQLRTLLASGVLARLETLELSGGDLSDRDVPFIVEHTREFSRLRSFVLGTQNLTPRGVKALVSATKAQVSPARRYQRVAE